MKKHLLLGSALVAAISAFPQNASLKQEPRVVNMAEKIAQKFAARNAMVENASTASSNSGSSQITALPQTNEPQAGLRASSTSTVPVYTTWNAFTGSMNIYGVLVADSRPLQYNDELNTVSFVHRKSNTYSPLPVPTTSNAATGALVAMISQNWGATWDSTCLWNDNNNWARYPQGGIINDKGVNSTNDITQAHIVGVAPITQANTSLGWIGSGFSWKNLGPGTYNNTSSAANQTFVANSSPYGGSTFGRKVDFPRLNFSTTSNGEAWALGQIFDGDVNATTVAGQDYRGARLVKMTFNSGNMVLQHDSIIPGVRRNSVSNDRFLISTPGMAWSEDGQTGYVWHIGASSTNSTLANEGYQPIVWKTTNGGAVWQAIPGIDFNNSAFTAPVLDHLNSTRTNTNLTVPFFNFTEGISGVVDANNNLHLVSLVWATAKEHADSVGYTYQYTNYDGEVYTYPHVEGVRPYLYDFTNIGSTWSVTVVDSLSSEDPGTRTTDDGYSSNPWDAAGGTSGTEKVSVDARIQTSRTADGKYLVYSWAETDTTITFNSVGFTKWNIFPNVKARLVEIGASGTGTVSPTEINVTKLTGPSGSPNSNVNNRGYNHYIAPRSAINATATAANTPSIVVTLPVTVSNNAALQQLNPVKHYYASANLLFSASTTPGTVTAVQQTAASSVSESYIYPNPAKNNAVLAIDMKQNTTVEVSVMNLVGQTVKAAKAETQVGANSINIDLSGLSKGIYMVNVKANNAVSTKKLIVE